MSHNFNNGAAVVGLHRIAEAVNCFNRGVCSGIVTEAVIGAADIVIDSGGNTYNGNSVFGKSIKSAECSVAAYGNDSVESELLAGCGGFVLTDLGHKFVASCGIKHRTAFIDNSGNAVGIKADYIAVDKAIISPSDTYTFDSFTYCGSYNGTDYSVHAGCVAAGSKDSYSFDFFIHM
jgi:hypothetical protein